jgi:hypothetical protein
MSNNDIPGKKVPNKRQFGKILHSRAGSGDNMAHAHWMLDT